ncbi:MAG: AGE family epimerase/isomerase [Eubacteriales bacterium]
MNKEDLLQIQRVAQVELFKSIDFWLTHGMDQEYGGIYNYLDQTGTIYSTDKSVWTQGKSAWFFSYLCSNYEQKEEWLTAAKSCLDFLENKCFNRNAKGRMYFQVTKEGKPLRQRRYCFSEAYYTIANAQYYELTQDPVYLARAKQSYQLIYNINNGIIKDPAGIGEKEISATRASRSLSIPLIFLNIIQVLAPLDKEKQKLYDRHAKECIDSIINFHMNVALQCTLETVGLDGTFWSEISTGRIINSGHSFRASWALLDYAKHLGSEGDSIRKTACNILEWTFDKLWDQEYGGFYYLQDCLGKPTEAFESDLKIWWSHTEALIATLMAYRDTREEKYLTMFYQVWKYCQDHFADSKYGEWYGYLNRNGTIKEPSVKGDTYKGSFHLPRCLMMIDQMIQEIL